MSKKQTSAPKTGFSKSGRLLLLRAGLDPREGEFLAKSTAVCACGRSLAEGCRIYPVARYWLETQKLGPLSGPKDPQKCI